MRFRLFVKLAFAVAVLATLSLDDPAGAGSCIYCSTTECVRCKAFGPGGGGGGVCLYAGGQGKCECWDNGQCSVGQTDCFITDSRSPAQSDVAEQPEPERMIFGADSHLEVSVTL